MKKTLLLITPTMLALTLGSSHAATVLIANADFEDGGPAPSSGFPQATSWDGTDTARLALHSGFAAPNNGSLGDNFVFTRGITDPASQTLAETFTPDTTYTLSSFTSYGGNDNPDAIYSIGYIDGGGAFQSLGTNTVDLAGDRTWTLREGVQYAAGAAGPEIGQSITIQIQSSTNNGLWFDNVTLDAVPEPSSTLLLGLAGALGLSRRRR